jgi:hypothetical protein
MAGIERERNHANDTSVRMTEAAANALQEVNLDFKTKINI